MPVKRYLLLPFVLLLFITNGFSGNLKSEVMDLSLVDLDTEFVTIQGEMHFCWDKFLSGTDLEECTDSLTTINTSNSWNNQSKVYSTYVAQGYGTYSFSVILPPDAVGKTLTLRPDHFISYASEIYVNGVLCANNGQVGESVDDPLYMPSRETHTHPFVADTNVLEVVIWVANFHHFRGGLFRPLILGVEENMTVKREKDIAIDLLVIVSLLIMFFYHLVMFGVNRFEKKSFYFAIACLVFSLDLSMQGPMCYFLMFPSSEFPFYSILHLVTPYIIPASFILFFYSLFPTQISKGITTVTIAISIVFTLITIFGTVGMRSAIIKPHYAYAGFLILYLFYVTYLLLRGKVYGARLFSSAYMVFALCAINDILNMFEIIQTTNLLTYGILVFVFLLSILYGKQTMHMYLATLSLSENLKDMNDELENTVVKRTGELKDSLENLSKLNQFQEGMTHMIVHDLKNPLMQIINIEQVREKDFASLRNSGYLMLNMIQNMLDLYRFNNNRVHVIKHPFEVYPVLEEVVHESSFYTIKKSLKVEIIQDETYDLYADVQIFKRVVTNLLSNAFRFSPIEGLVQIKLRAIEDYRLHISISNQGPPLDEMQQSEIFKSSKVFDDTSDEKYRTSGLGLYLCKMAVDAHKGDIGVHSDGVNGVDFWFTMPGVIVKDPLSIHQVITASSTLKLSSEDLHYLVPFATKMQNFEVFDSSKIDAIIGGMDFKTKGIRQWATRVEKACYALDEEKLRGMLDLILKH